MIHLDKLLKGVEVDWKTLGEVAELKRGTTITKKTSNEGDFPVISGGQQPAYYIDQFNRSGETITVAGSGAYAGYVMFWNEPIFVCDAFSIKTDESKVLPRYIFHFLLNFQDKIHDLQSGGGVPHVYAKDVARFQIPIPSLEIQQKIVEILDSFTELTSELTSELTARKQQYEYYRDKLMTFNESDLEWRNLKEVSSVMRGRRLTKNQLSNENKFPVYHGGLDPLGYYGQKNRPANSVMIINVGASAGTVGFSNIDFWSSDGCFCLEHSFRLNSKFLYYYILGFQNHLKSKVRKAGIPTLDSSVIEKLRIPILPLDEQEKIVTILDKFESISTSLSEGLPKEIELRKKQYEYYRDLLLTFPKKENT